MKAARPLPARTLEALAACQALGLMFWSDHPKPRHVWAVDEGRRAHVVRIDCDTHQAQHVCGPTILVADELCVGGGGAVPYATAEKKDRPQPIEGSGPEHPTNTQSQEGRPNA